MRRSKSANKYGHSKLPTVKNENYDLNNAKKEEDAIIPKKLYFGSAGNQQKSDDLGPSSTLTVNDMKKTHYPAPFTLHSNTETPQGFKKSSNKSQVKQKKGNGSSIRNPDAKLNEAGNKRTENSVKSRQWPKYHLLYNNKVPSIMQGPQTLTSPGKELSSPPFYSPNKCISACGTHYNTSPRTTQHNTAKAQVPPLNHFSQINTVSLVNSKNTANNKLVIQNRNCKNIIIPNEELKKRQLNSRSEQISLRENPIKERVSAITALTGSHLSQKKTQSNIYKDNIKHFKTFSDQLPNFTPDYTALLQSEKQKEGRIFIPVDSSKDLHNIPSHSSIFQQTFLIFFRETKGK
jgi:hypothetical protein